jgi:hypothetical protein
MVCEHSQAAQEQVAVSEPTTDFDSTFYQHETAFRRRAEPYEPYGEVEELSP